MTPRQVLTGLWSLALLSGLLVVTTAAAPAASSTALSRVVHAKLVGHSAFQAGPTGLTEGVDIGSAPLAFTDESRPTPGGASTAGTPTSNLRLGGIDKSIVPATEPAGGGEGTDSGVTTAKGLNAFDMANTHGFIVEPPDQGLCANNDNVIEMVNLVLRVYDTNFNPVSGTMQLETFFGVQLAFGVVPGTDFTVQGDPRCYWDPKTERWYLSQLFLDLSNNTSQFMLAVSQTSNWMDGFNLYALDNTDNFNPGCPCFGDQPTMGANRDAIFITTNEFSINNPVFNGSVMYAIDKTALAEGDAFANTVVDFIGLSVPTPGQAPGSCTTSNGLFCWASVRPTTSPGEGDTRFGGVEYLLSALDFANTHDNRISLFAATNTRSIRSDNPSIGLVQTTINSEAYVFPNQFAAQKAGPIPLGDSGRFNHGLPQPEGLIQTNDDQIQGAVYANGLVWGALNTVMPNLAQGKFGAAYFEVRPRLTGEGFSGSIAKQGYVVAPGANVIFPSVAVDSEGHGIMSFTVTGNNMFPSSGFTTLNRHGAGKVQIAAAGQSPQDGFTEYQNAGTPAYRPRWGDYSAAVAVDNTIFFADEYIQSPNCSDAAYALDTTCGHTRTRSANWGTALNKIEV